MPGLLSFFVTRHIKSFIYSPQDKLYFHHALWQLFFSYFSHKNIFFKRPPAPPPPQYYNSGPLTMLDSASESWYGRSSQVLYYMILTLTLHYETTVIHHSCQSRGLLVNGLAFPLLALPDMGIQAKWKTWQINSRIEYRQQDIVDVPAPN